VEFPYSFRGTDFNISFDYTVYDGVTHFHTWPERLDENPYKYGWSVRRCGDTDYALLLLPHETQDDYGVYPLVLNLHTREISNPVEWLDLGGIVPYNWRFADNMAFAVLYGFQSGNEDHWLCDIENRTLTSMSELMGRRITDCYILDEHHIICYVADGDGFDVVSFDPATGASVTLAESVKRYGQTDDNSGFCNIEYYGGYGRHAMLFDGTGGVTLFDLLTGRRTPLEGITDGGDLLTSESPDGEHIMVAFRDRSVPKSISMYKIGVLDTETGVLKLMERTNYQVRSETPLGWLADDCVAVIAFDEGADSGWYLYVYDFRSEQTSPPRTPAEPSDDEPVRVKDYIPDIYVDLKYATTDNFTGQVIYDFTDAYLRYGTVKKLAAVQKELTEMGYSLKIWDAYRPIGAQFRLWEVCPDPVYVANPNVGYSKHSKGNTVDVTLVLSDGGEITMPTGFDDFSTKADRDYSDVSDQAAANARLLENTMSDHGFNCYFGEWWHFSDTTDYPVLDFTPPIDSPARPVGDIAGDREINNVDVVTLARYIVGLYDEATAAAVRMYADMDGDGIITNSDLVALARVCVNIA
jgi:D-alanyl-D-alanine dipeptidase